MESESGVQIICINITDIILYYFKQKKKKQYMYTFYFLRFYKHIITFRVLLKKKMTFIENDKI